MNPPALAPSDRQPLLLALAIVATTVSGCASGTAPAPELADGLAPEVAGQYRVLLPPGYPDAGPYPVVYFLHDYFGGSAVLWRKGVAAELERRMAAGELPPFVLVAPEGDRGYWSDAFDGRRLYETWLHDQMVPEIERRYRVIPAREGRAVTGISMGGFGALKSALHRPDLWSHASSLSGALIPLDPESVAGYGWLQRRILRRIFGPLDGANVYARDDLRTLARRPAPANAPPLLLRAGREDEYRLAEAAKRTADLLETSGWSVTLVLEPGAHDWKYWKVSAVETIAWHARRFAAPPAPSNSPGDDGPLTHPAPDPTLAATRSPSMRCQLRAAPASQVHASVVTRPSSRSWWDQH